MLKDPGLWDEYNGLLEEYLACVRLGDILGTFDYLKLMEEKRRDIEGSVPPHAAEHETIEPTALFGEMRYLTEEERAEYNAVVYKHVKPLSTHAAGEEKPDFVSLTNHEQVEREAAFDELDGSDSNHPATSQAAPTECCPQSHSFPVQHGPDCPSNQAALESELPEHVAYWVVPEMPDWVNDAVVEARGEDAALQDVAPGATSGASAIVRLADRVKELERLICLAIHEPDLENAITIIEHWCPNDMVGFPDHLAEMQNRVAELERERDNVIIRHITHTNPRDAHGE